jgi:hypothetical protein
MLKNSSEAEEWLCDLAREGQRYSSQELRSNGGQEGQAMSSGGRGEGKKNSQGSDRGHLSPSMDKSGASQPEDQKLLGDD